MLEAWLILPALDWPIRDLAGALIMVIVRRSVLLASSSLPLWILTAQLLLSATGLEISIGRWEVLE